MSRGCENQALTATLYTVIPFFLCEQITTMRGKTLSVNVVVTRMKHGGSIVLHISMVDVTDLKRLLEVRSSRFHQIFVSFKYVHMYICTFIYLCGR
jgi:ABC-type amino acid transport system permease subunit